jgi:hypothetical protein
MKRAEVPWSEVDGCQQLHHDFERPDHEAADHSSYRKA